MTVPERKTIKVGYFRERFYRGCSLILNNADLTMFSVIYAAYIRPLLHVTQFGLFYILQKRLTFEGSRNIILVQKLK